MMGLDNPIHIAFLLIVLLLVFGAKRLPEMGHSLGSGLRGFKDAIGGEGASSSLDVAAERQAPIVAQTPAAPVAPVAPAVEEPLSVASTPTTTLVGVQNDRSAA
jgi:sec-independent protein translocase protein TatA